MRYTIHTERGDVPADIVELTVGKGPGYRITIPGYSAQALFERDGEYWDYAVTAPGRLSSKSGRLDSRLTKDVVRIYGGKALVHYIEDNAIPLRTGQVPQGEPTRPADRDAPYRTGPTYRRTKYGRLRRNHSGILGAVLDTLVDVFWE